MALIRWEPAREIESLQQEMNRLFGSLFDSQGGRVLAADRRWVPSMDLVETGDHYVLRADLPGVQPGDVKVELEDDVLTISGERKLSQETQEGGVRRIERASGAFARSLTLPSGIDPSGIQASFEHGVLEVKVPKPEERKPHRVQVQVAGSGKESVIEGSAAEGETQQSQQS
jgi:HSP20 family protein